MPEDFKAGGLNRLNWTNEDATRTAAEQKERRAAIVARLNLWVAAEQEVTANFNINKKNLAQFIKEHPGELPGIRKVDTLIGLFTNINYLRKKLGLPELKTRKDQFI